MTTSEMYPIPVGLYCVPAALVALTGADFESVIFPALNRASGAQWLIGPVAGIQMGYAKKALEEMGWNVRRYKHSGRLSLALWSLMSVERWPERKLLVATDTHALAVCNGRVYDTFTPYGGEGNKHPFAKDIVEWASLIEKR